MFFVFQVLGEEKGKRVIEMDWGQEVELDGCDWRGEEKKKKEEEKKKEENKDSVSAKVPDEKKEDEKKKDEKKEDEKKLTTTQEMMKNRPPLTVVCVPCQHWCKRTPTDTNKCLWYVSLISWFVSLLGTTLSKYFYSQSLNLTYMNFVHGILFFFYLLLSFIFIFIQKYTGHHG